MEWLNFLQAQETYEKAMEKAKKEHERNNASPSIFPEYQLWEDHWIRQDLTADVEQVFYPAVEAKYPAVGLKHQL